MDTKIVARVTIHAEPAKVFEYLVNLKYHDLWNPQIRSISRRGRLKLGSKYKTESEVLGIPITASNTVTELIPDQEFELENNTGAVRYLANFRLSYRPINHTIVTLTVAMVTESKLIGIASPVLERLARYELKMDLEALKIAVEGELQ